MTVIITPGILGPKNLLIQYPEVPFFSRKLRWKRYKYEIGIMPNSNGNRKRKIVCLIPHSLVSVPNPFMTDSWLITIYRELIELLGIIGRLNELVDRYDEVESMPEASAEAAQNLCRKLRDWVKDSFWKDYFPDIDPDDWDEVEEDSYGIPREFTENLGNQRALLCDWASSVYCKACNFVEVIFLHQETYGKFGSFNKELVGSPQDHKTVYLRTNIQNLSVYARDKAVDFPVVKQYRDEKFEVEKKNAIEAKGQEMACATSLELPNQTIGEPQTPETTVTDDSQPAREADASRDCTPETPPKKEPDIHDGGPDLHLEGTPESTETQSDNISAQPCAEATFDLEIKKLLRDIAKTANNLDKREIAEKIIQARKFNPNNNNYKTPGPQNRNYFWAILKHKKCKPKHIQTIWNGLVVTVRETLGDADTVSDKQRNGGKIRGGIRNFKDRFPEVFKDISAS